MMTKSKIIPAFFFVLLLAFLGLFFGTMTGSLLAPKDSGLAGPAIALGYGLLGFITATAAGVILARRLAYSQLRTALLWTTVAVLFCCGWLVYRFWVVQKQQLVAIHAAKLFL
jgi:hypothetical protein